MKAWQGSVGISTYRGIVSGHYICFQPHHDNDPRFLNHLLRSPIYTAELRRLSRGVRPNQFEIDNDLLRALPVHLPPLSEQRAIADYLGAETARIDALITKKRRMIEALEERQSGLVEHRIRAFVAERGALPLKHAVREVTVGIVITPAKWYVDDGVPALRGVNVGPGSIDMTDCVFLSDEGHAANRKSTIRTGDVVVVRTGQAGAAAVVPRDLDGANCIDLLLIRPSKQMDSKYLEYVLNSDWTIKHVAEHSVGTIQAHFNVGALRELPVAVPTLMEQRAAVTDLDRECGRLTSMQQCLSAQLDLLAERRQVLITAAVTGELEIPGVAA